MGADTNPGVYPGNTSLPKEVREKILSTFRHALNLFHERKIDDCVIGCDFILKMDPRFSPARQLLDKARNPAADIDVGELELLVATTPTPQQKVNAAEPDRLLVRAVESYNARDFPAAIASAEQVLAVLPGNHNAKEILENARRKQSVQPQFDQARVRALAALEAGRGADARKELAMMRGLDADHPAVTLLERRIGTAPAAAAAGGSSFEQQFGASASEPEIAFDQSGGHFGDDTMPRAQPAALDFGAPHGGGGGLPGGGLETLSLDSLSLDLPEPGGPVVPPPPNTFSSASGPLGGPMSHAPMPPPISSAAPGSPQDLWSDDTAASPEPMIDPLPAYSSAPPPPSPGEGPSPDEEVDMLLRQGDEAAGRGDRQQAIEVWSRIFLIDINNSDAVTRIEKARQEMAEGNRRISEGLRGGRESFEKGDFSGAREKFLQVLAVDGTEATARFYLERIEEELIKPPAPAAAPPPTPAGASADVLAGIGSTASLGATAPSGAAAPPAKPRTSRVSAKSLPPRTRLIAIAAALLLVAGGAVYFFVLRSPSPRPGAAAAQGGPSLEDAMALFREGKVEETAAALRRIPASHPDYARAQKLLASLGGGGAPAEGGGAPLEGEGGAAAAAPQQNEPARLRSLAEAALSEKRYIDALTNFNLAAPAYSADPDFARARGSAIEKVTELTPAVKLYNEAEYETAIPILWRIHSADRENQDARSYLFRAYYNQGIAQLQNGLYEKAGESFREAASLNTGDEEAARHQKFARRYEKRDLDLMGRIYVRHVQPRP